LYSGEAKNEDERERLFQKRIAELGFKRQQLPWNMAERPLFNLPREQTKLFSDKEIEGPELSDEEVERRALMDLLSQTYNFRTFYKRLNYELKRAIRYQRTLSLVLVGIDALDEIGRAHGPESVEAVVKSAALLLLSSIRDVDIAGRCRDDTFGVILPETSEPGAEVAAERIRTKMEKQTVDADWRGIRISASVGASCYQPAPEGSTIASVDELFARAAEALLKTMQEGGNGITFG
jgi:diguanylate cyclase (GGDEF)-like protein